MAERVRARRLSDEEGQRLLRIVRRGEPKAAKSVIRYRRAMVVLASAGGNSVPVIARLVAAAEDTVREVIHRLNELGMRALDPHWAGGRPRQISAEDEAFLVETARTRPRKLGYPFTHWSVRKLIGYWPTTRTGWCTSAGNGPVGSCSTTRSPFSRPRPGRSPPIPTETPSWPASSR